MDIRKVRVPINSYPRYVYTASAASRIYKRFNVLLKRTELHDNGIYVPPKYENPTLFITLPKSGDKHFNELQLQLKRSQGQLQYLENVGSVEALRQEGIENTAEKVVVVVTDRPNERLDWVEELMTNTVIVTSSEDISRKLTENNKFIQEFNVPVVVAGTGDTLALAIDALLERIVFRKLHSLIEILRNLKEVDKGHLVEEAVRVKLSEQYIPGMFRGRANVLRGIFSEIKGQLDSETETVDIPEELRVIDDIAERYSKEVKSFYLLLYKISVEIAQKLEQFVHGRYRELPADVQNLISVDIEAGSIYSLLQPEILKFVIIYFPKELVLADDVDEPEVTMFLQKVRPSKDAFIDGLMKLVKALPMVVEVDRRLRNVKDMYEGSFHRLLWEIKAMYNRSKVPDVEKPQSGNEGKTLSPKIAKRLFSRVNVAIGTGYRCDKLHVYIRENSKIDTEQAKKDIKDVLAEFHISDFRVISSKDTVTHFRRVGAKIRAARHGTLGGFAWMLNEGESSGTMAERKAKGDTKLDDKNKQLCALISKHVVNGSNEVYWIPNHEGDSIHIGSIIQADEAGVQHMTCSIDVAAARILRDQQNICDRRFRNSRREPCDCRLYDFDDMLYLQGLPVHFCGASTELGLGTITAPDFFYQAPAADQAEPLHYVIIEDIEPIEGEDMVHFSNMGDSGGIICADNPDGEFVHVISMLIGSFNYNEREEDNNVTDKYISFRMKDGLEELTRKTNNTFMLCSD